MGDIRYIHSFVIGKDSCDLTSRLISTHIFEVRDAKVSTLAEGEIFDTPSFSAVFRQCRNGTLG